MGKNYYQPANNYEKNFMMVKRFSGKITVLILPILFFLSIACSCYLAMFDGQLLEVSILKVVNSKLNFDFEMSFMENYGFLLDVIISGFCAYSLLYIFVKSKNSDFDSSPDFGYALIYRLSMVLLLLLGCAFVGAVFFTVMFIIRSPEKFESIGEMFKLTVEDLKAYKISIVIILFLADAILFVMAWFVQSQTDFLKSVRSSLVESIPKNKGAHTYGVFSMVMSIALIGVAALVTFMYYCYQDAFSGFGIDMNKTYVCVSLAHLYIRGLIPFFIAIDAFAFSAIVDESNALGGMIFNNYDVIGDAEDPNMARKERLR